MPFVSPERGAVGTAVAALYFNAFVGVIEAFQKLPFLRPLAQAQSEPPFIVVQLAVVIAFPALGILAGIKFHPEIKAGT